MKKVEISVRQEKGAKPISVLFNIGENLAELVKQFGEATVFDNARSALVVALQGFTRTKLTGKKPIKPGAELQKAVDEWKPGKRAGSADKIAKLKERLDKLSPEEKKALGIK